MKILVTGATGALGRLLSAHLQGMDAHQVVRSGRQLFDAADYIPCAFDTAQSIDDLIRQVRPDRIFHCTGGFSGDLEQDMWINCDAVRALFDALLKNGLSARVVLFGSAAEYGVVHAEENPLPESRALRPVSVYGLTKSIQAQLASFYAHHHHVDVVLARVFNLFIPGLSSRLFVGKVQQAIKAIKRGDAHTIEVGNLDSARDYIEPEQALQQVMAIADKGVAGEVYHVASGVPVVMRNLLERMVREAGLDWSVVRSSAGNVSARYDVSAIYADISKTTALYKA